MGSASYGYTAKKTFILVLSVVAGYRVGYSIRYAQSAPECDLLSPDRNFFCRIKALTDVCFSATKPVGQ